MPSTFDARRLRHARVMDARLTADHRQLARIIAGMVLRAGTARDAKGQAIIPLSLAKSDALKIAVWEQAIKPFYIGPGTDALIGAAPQSPYARLIVEGITEATRIQAERQVAIVRSLVDDPVVVRWLTGPRSLLPIRELRATYDPFHRFVDPNGYRLSDRIWNTGVDVRARVDRLLTYHIERGTSAVEMADILEQFLTPGGRLSRTRTPYGSEGSYAARRLARTEITAAAGRATVNASAANPFVNSIQWRLSGSHRDADICDQYANGGPNGDGIYPIDQVPTYPSHPHELCSLLPVPVGATADLVAGLRADIQAARPRARALQGILNVSWLVSAILGGFIDEAIARIKQVFA